MGMDVDEAVELFCILDQHDRFQKYEEHTRHIDQLRPYIKGKPQTPTPLDFGFLG